MCHRPEGSALQSSASLIHSFLSAGLSTSSALTSHRDPTSLSSIYFRVSGEVVPKVILVRGTPIDGNLVLPGGFIENPEMNDPDYNYSLYQSELPAKTIWPNEIVVHELNVRFSA